MAFPEVYAPNLALLNTTLLLLLLWARRPTLLRYAAFALAFGLSLGTHLSNLGFAPAFALFTVLILARRGVSPRDWVATVLVGGGAFALGAAQFLWVPLRAASLPPALILGQEAPTTLAGLYRYTLGAFSNLRFAFPLADIPERVALYLYYLVGQFGLSGLLLGMAGMLTMPFLRPRRFLLLVRMYLAHLVFFLEYRAFALEVFFIPVHAVWAWWMAFGWWGIFNLLRAGTATLGWRPAPFIRTLGVVLLSGLLLAQGLVPLSTHWAERNLSQDTAVDDFYAAVWQVLPSNATLLSPGGVFGYDVFYWRLVYHTRPDVSLPALEDPSPRPLTATASQGTLFSTTTALQRRRGPQATSLDRFWAVPVVLGEQPEGSLGPRSTPLVLLALQSTPPVWKVSSVPEDLPRIEAHLQGATLVAARLTPQRVESGGLLHLTLYWRIDRPQQVLSQTPRLTLRLGERSLAQYTLGFGLLSRYAQEVGLQAGDLLAIDYGVVVPSTFEAASGVPLQLVTDTGAVLTLGQVDVVDEWSPWAYWLAVARGDR